MLFRVHLTKQETYWWDEKKIGTCLFSASHDEHAWQIVFMLVRRINREFARIGQPRYVFVSDLYLIGDDANESKLSLASPVQPLSSFGKIRRHLEFFYPREEKGRRGSKMVRFSHWKEIPFPTHKFSRVR